MSVGWTALHFAVSFQHLSVVQRLVERGAYCEGGVRAGEENTVITPLQLACAAGKITNAYTLLILSTVYNI